MTDRSQAPGVADQPASPDAGSATDLSGDPDWAADKAGILVEEAAVAAAETGVHGACLAEALTAQTADGREMGSGAPGAAVHTVAADAAVRIVAARAAAAVAHVVAVRWDEARNVVGPAGSGQTKAMRWWPASCRRTYTTAEFVLPTSSSIPGNLHHCSAIPSAL